MMFFSDTLLRNRYFSKAYRVLVCPIYWRWLKRRHKQNQWQKLKKIGSDYGGWHVPVDEFTENSIIYSAGIGADTSFDQGLIELYGCSVLGIDPTPASIDHVASVGKVNESFREKFIHLTVALWNREQQLKLYEPRTYGKWVGSYSAHNLQGMSDYIDVEAKRLSTIMAENDHVGIDLLKIDIEGAEYEVLDNLINCKIFPRWLAVEFDQPVPFWTTNKAIGRLLGAGYTLVNIDNWNVLFTYRNQGVPN